MAVLTVLETAWPCPLFWGGERPELLVAGVTSAGVVFGAQWGLASGFFAAVFHGAMERQPWGALFLAYMLIGILAGTIGHRLLVRRALAAVPAVLATGAVFKVVVLVLQPPPAFGLWLAGAFHAIVYTMLAAIPVHGFALWLRGLAAQPWAPWR